jgi:hypothetical protein
LLRVACLTGRVYLQGNDRSHSDRVADVGKAATEILGQVLPALFDRFKEAAAKLGFVFVFSIERLEAKP